MSVTRINGSQHAVQLDIATQLTGAQRLQGLALAGQALGASAAQAAVALCTLPLLPTGAPIWLGLRAASNLRAGLCTLGHAVTGAPARDAAVDAEHVAALCTDVTQMLDGGDARVGCTAAGVLLRMDALTLGAWRDEVESALATGLGRVVSEAIAQARRCSDADSSRGCLSDASSWLRRWRADAYSIDTDAYYIALRRLEVATAHERWWWQAAQEYGQSLDAQARGDDVLALQLLEAALRNPLAEVDDARTLPLRELCAHLQVTCAKRLRVAMQSAVDAEDWHAAGRAADALMVFAHGRAAFEPEGLLAKAVHAQSLALVGEAGPTFEALENSLRAVGLDTPWRMQQINEARILLGPADTPGFATLADEIIVTHVPPADIDHPRVIHARLPNLFYHPERNRHGPYIKLVPQAMLAGFGAARRRDAQAGTGTEAQRDFFAEAFQNLCFEGRADVLMEYLAKHPVSASEVDGEVVADIHVGMDDKAVACEHFRVFNAVQLRRFATERGIEPRSPAFAASRAQLEAMPDYTGQHCNPERFARYLASQDFVRERSDRDAYVALLVAYLRDDVGVL